MIARRRENWDLVCRAGDRVRGWGRYVADDDGEWLDLARVHDLVLRTGPDPRSREFSIRIAGGLDPAALPTGFAPGGVVPGCVTLTGTWDGSALHVEAQSPVPPVDERPEDAAWTVPPCPPPPGGWPRGTNGDEYQNLTFDPGDLEATGAAVTVVTFRPGADQLVLVVAATDADRVHQVLDPQLGGRLCVVPSRFTRAELDAVTDTLLEHMQDWSIEVIGGSVDERAQESVRAELLWVGEDLATWADTLTPGLLTLHPALRPVR